MSCKLILPDRLHLNVLLSSISEKLICWTRSDQNLHWTVQTCLSSLTCSHHDPNIANLPTDAVLRSILQWKTRTTGRRRKKHRISRLNFPTLWLEVKRRLGVHTQLLGNRMMATMWQQRTGGARKQLRCLQKPDRFSRTTSKWSQVKNFYFERLREVLLVFLHKAFQLCSFFKGRKLSLLPWYWE